MSRKTIVLFILILLFFPYTSAYSPKITGITHYHDGFLVLTHYSNNTTQLWFFEPGKGFRLLNATFLNLTFMHSNGKRVLMYRNLSDIYSAPDVQLYVYDGELHHLGDFNGVTDCGDDLYVYWNGEFYLLFQPWDACQMTGYDWYAIVNGNGTIFKLPGGDRGWSTVCTHSKCYVDNLQVVPHGYMVGYTDFYTELTTLRLVTLSNGEIQVKNLTFGNLYAKWSGACFNGTHFATLLGNWMELPYVSTLKFYLAVIDTRGNYRIIPLDSVPSNENVSLELLGSHGGSWVVRKYRYWILFNPNSSSGFYYKTKTMPYFLVSPRGVVELSNDTKITATCQRDYPQIVFEGRHVVESPLKLNGKNVTINGSLLLYSGMTLKLPFNVSIADCGNGCLLSNGEELAYFDGYTVKPIKLPVNRAMIRWLSLLGVTFALLFIGGLAKARRR